MIEYEDNNDNYIEPERHFENDVIAIRLYCSFPGCKKYIKGTEGYNGSFLSEDGKHCDLRNQEYKCSEHSRTNLEKNNDRH